VGASVTETKSLWQGRDFREWISGAHIVWTKESPEFLAEFANVNHRAVLTDLSTTPGLYVQLGYRLPWFEHTVSPTDRFEYTHTPLSERCSRTRIGRLDSRVRIDITNYAAFKTEYRNFRRGIGEPRVNGWFARPIHF